METIKPGFDAQVQLGTDAYVKKRRRRIKEEPKMDDSAVKLNPELSASNSSSPESSWVGEGGGKEGKKGPSICVPHGSMSVIGRRRAMEDALTVAPGELASYDFYAVYDGHGGAKVACLCRDRLHRLLSKEIEDATDVEGPIDWENVMVTSFSKMDEEINGEANKIKDRSISASLKSMGSTAVVVVVGPEKLVVANCGDSRAVLCRRGAAIPLSRDHKVTSLSSTPPFMKLLFICNLTFFCVFSPPQPDRPDERERVEAAGGKVINWNGFRILGVLSTSRSIGIFCFCFCFWTRGGFINMNQTGRYYS